MITLILLFLPLISGLICLALPRNWVKNFAFISSLVNLGLIIYTWTQGSVVSDWTKVNMLWVESLGIHFKLGLDGISLLMVFLTNLTLPLIILSSFKTEYSKPNLFYFLILFMQTGLIGVFTSLDGFLFYVAWEIALIPIYFISGMWGGQHRAKITLKFFIYTITGSLFMLLGIIYLYLLTPQRSFDIDQFYALNINGTTQNLIFLSFFLAFAIKVPIFPFHTWQPDTYTDAPTQGSMLLGGIMLKMGLYGIIRWLLPISPKALALFSPYILVLAVTGVVYAGIIAFRQSDLKRLLAYSSLSHVGLIAAALFVNSYFGIQGGLIQMLSHAVNIVGLFYVVSLVQKQAGTRDINLLGGIAAKAPVLATCFLIIVLGSVALPLTDGFVGEFLMLKSLFEYNIILSIVAGTTLILGAVYMLRMYQKIMLGEETVHTQSFVDIKGTDRISLILICLLVILIGVYPNPILNLTKPDVVKILVEVSTKLNLH
jgi:NADH-quinone oxidoreductase subunit M